MQNKTWIKDYIGKPEKKTKIQEEVDKLVASAELSEIWKESLQTLASNSPTWQNKTITTVGNTFSQYTAQPQLYQYTAQPQLQPAIKYTPTPLIEFGILTRLFTPSDNGVFFPC